MTHWGWYWKHKQNHQPKVLCSDSSLHEIDSFDLFKNKKGIEWIKNSEEKTFFAIYNPFHLEAYIEENNNIKIVFDKFSYIISVEKKPCNFGGFYHFFNCPSCKKRMRKLYCINGFYLCRKCANLGYYSQRLNPTDRSRYMQIKIKETLEKHAGSLDAKPPWMRKSTFNRLRKRYIDYGKKGFLDLNNEMNHLYLEKVSTYLAQYYSLFIPSNMLDVYDHLE